METYKSEEAIIKTRKKLTTTLTRLRVFMGVSLGYASGEFIYAFSCTSLDSYSGWDNRLRIAIYPKSAECHVLQGGEDVKAVSLQLAAKKLKPRFELFVPLAETCKCSAALMLMDHSQLARRNRDEALAIGRRLYVFGYTAMRAAVEADLSKLEAANQAEACRKLHNVSVSPVDPIRQYPPRLPPGVLCPVGLTAAPQIRCSA